MIDNSSMFTDGASNKISAPKRTLPDGSIVRCSFAHQKAIDFEVKSDPMHDNACPTKEEAREWAERLVREGKSFVMCSGSSDDTLQNEFTIEKPAGK